MSDLTTPASPLATVSEAEANQARAYARAATSEATRKAYRADMDAWRAWAASHQTPAMPCVPEMLAVYLGSMAADHKPASIARRLAAICSAHRMAGYEPPRRHAAVRAVIAGIRRTLGVRQHQAKPITPEALRAAVEKASPRDRALLLLGFAGAFRRSELVALDVADLTWSPEGLAVTLRRSKTDQDGEGRVVGIPRVIATQAVEQWIAGRTAGRVFPITAGMVGRIVKRLLGEEYSAHGLRSGFCTAAALAGKDALAIQRQTGHKSLVQLAKYCRPGLFEKNAGEGIL